MSTVKLLFKIADKLQLEVYKWFSDSGLGARAAAAPRHGHAIVKTLITGFQTDEQPEGTEIEREGKGGVEAPVTGVRGIQSKYSTALEGRAA